MEELEKIKALIAGKSTATAASALYEAGYRDCTQQVYVVHCKERDSTTMQDDLWIKGVFFDPVKADAFYDQLREAEAVFKEVQLDPVGVTL